MDHREFMTMGRNVALQKVRNYTYLSDICPDIFLYFFFFLQCFQGVMEHMHENVLPGKHAMASKKHVRGLHLQFLFCVSTFRNTGSDSLCTNSQLRFSISRPRVRQKYEKRKDVCSLRSLIDRYG